MSLAAHIQHNHRRGSDTKILRQLSLESLRQFVGSDDPYGKPIGELGDHFSISVDPSGYGIDYPVAPNINPESASIGQCTGRTTQNNSDNIYEFDSGDVQAMFSLDTDPGAKRAKIISHTRDATDDRTWGLWLELALVDNDGNPSKNSFWVMFNFCSPEFQLTSKDQQRKLIASLSVTIDSGHIGVVPYIDKCGREGFDLCPLGKPVSRPIDRAHNSTCEAHA